ncbi:MAG: FHA domain-containing protein [Leptolyngbyaceae cyanobacterium bins.349]|nr:FHA domain-containing protein [Leptolyngbyaceae cyanobacterium bins.349]
MLPELKHLLIIEDGLGGLQRHVLNAPLYSIGRDPKCDIRLSSQFVSRRQATLVKITDDHGQFYYRIVDGVPKGRTSSNGMLINGRKILACDLQDQDEIIFGPHVRAVYRLSEEQAEVEEPFFDDTLIPTQCWGAMV